MTKCESDWRKSQYAMVISTIRTNVYLIDNCIDDLLEANENVCVLLFNDTSTLMGHFVSSPREREKRER